jgi:hypothetical protein
MPTALQLPAAKSIADKTIVKKALTEKALAGKALAEKAAVEQAAIDKAIKASIDAEKAKDDEWEKGGAAGTFGEEVFDDEWILL